HTTLFRSGQKRRAAQVAPARTDATLDAGGVASRQLAQLHPAVQRGAEVAHQRTEIDPVWCGEIDGRAWTVAGAGIQHVIDRDDLHRQFVLADQPLSRHLRLRLAATKLLVAAYV